MAELADALDSKSCIFGCAGSTPALGTIYSLTICGAILCSLTHESYGARAHLRWSDPLRARSCRRFPKLNNHTGRDSRIG